MHWLIGIDDTDNLDSRGTGFHARQLLKRLTADGIVRGVGITRHQLLVDDRVPYTSHNSSACLQVTSELPREAIAAAAREHLLANEVPGSDVGLCVATPEEAQQCEGFGLRAQRDVIDQDLARAAIAGTNILLEGLTGTRDGIIGALSATALYMHGNDGRYIWRPHLRELENRTMSLGRLLAETGIEDVLLDGETSLLPDLEDGEHITIETGDWPRPVRMDGQCVLLVVAANELNTHFHCMEKTRVKALRP